MFEDIEEYEEAFESWYDIGWDDAEEGLNYYTASTEYRRIAYEAGYLDAMESFK